METISEQQRIDFSNRLTQELKRIGLPIGSPTQIARAFNQNYTGQAVSAQTVRKWLFSEAMPTQPKLLALAAWLGVSAQWLRYGSCEKVETALPSIAHQSGIEPLLDKLTRLSPRDLRIIEGIVQLMYAENEGKNP